MFLKKLGLSKKQTDALTIATGIFILGILLIISMMVFNNDGVHTDIDLLGYSFKASDTQVLIGIPEDEGFTTVEISDETQHGLETLSNFITDADVIWRSILRNGLIFLYLLAVLIIIIKNKETHFQGLIKGFLIGTCLLLLLFVLQGLLDVRTLLVKFSHEYHHLFYHLRFLN